MLMAVAPCRILAAMKIFARLKKLREFQKTRLPHLRSIEDFDIIYEIGASQENGGGRMTSKRLALLGIAPPATLQRRLSRLVALGVIEKQPACEDGRIVELSVSRKTAEAYANLARQLRQAPQANKKADRE